VQHLKQEVFSRGGGSN